MSKEFDVLGGWVVHLIGPDDVFPHSSEAEALRAANDINKGIANMPRQPNDPFILAVAKNTQTEEL